MSKKIVLVEDDHDTCRLIENAFVTAGYQVESLHEGKSIIDQHFQLPDLFILDNTIPTIDGIALCKYLKIQQKTKSIPVIMISGNHLLETKAMKAGASVFIAKPFKVESLVEHVEMLLHPQLA